MTYTILKKDYIRYSTEIDKNIETFFQNLLNVRLQYKAAQKANDTKTMKDMEQQEQDLRMRYESRAKVLNQCLNQLKSQVDKTTYTKMIAEVNNQ